MVREQLSDPGGHGSVYRHLSNLPFDAYFTTNFDSVFERQLRESGVAPLVYTNAEDSLTAYDPTVRTKKLVYLHGSLDREGELVLTDADFSRVKASPVYTYYQVFVQAFLVNSPILILGYSMSDPDLREIAERVRFGYKRKSPVLALIADAEDDDLRDFREKYNIDARSYSSDASHQELTKLLAAADQWLKVEQFEPAANLDLGLVQKLYVWKSVTSASDSLLRGGLKALTVFLLAQTDRPLSLNEIGAAAEAAAGYSRVYDEQLASAMKELVEQDLVNESGSKYSLTSTGRASEKMAHTRYDQLWSNIAEQAALDLGLEASEAALVGKLLQDLLVGLFSERASEAMSLALHSLPIETSSLRLFDFIAGYAAGIPHGSLRYSFISYTINMLRRPNPSQRAAIDYLARVFFAVQGLRLDKATNQVVSDFVGKTALVVDSNILITLLAQEGGRHDDVTNLLGRAREEGVALYTTEGFVFEAQGHYIWAEDFMSKSPSDLELLAAAVGRSPYDGNEFLTGFVTSGARRGHAAFMDYIDRCFGSRSPDRDDTKRVLADVYGIKTLSKADVASSFSDYSDVHGASLDFINAASNPGKSGFRRDAEAEAYASVYGWPAYAAAQGLPCEAYVLSAGGFLDRVATESPYPLKRSCVATLTSLAAFMDTFIRGNAVDDFADLVKTDYFHSAADFVDPADLSRYFDSTIAAAERLYEEKLLPVLRKYQSILAPGDIPDTLAEVAPLDRPFVVRSFESVAADVGEIELSAELRAELRSKEDEIEELTTRVSRYEQKDQGRERYEKRMANRPPKGRKRRS